MDDILSILTNDEIEEVEEENFKVKPLYDPFDFINSINDHRNLFEGKTGEELRLVEDCYKAWIINKGFSYYKDTVRIANILNQYSFLDVKICYDLLISTVRPKKRWSKWYKKETNDDIDIVKEAYGYSESKASAALSLLSASDLQQIRKRLNKGGLSNDNKRKKK